MSNWPTTAVYHERLALDGNGAPTPVEVVLPSTRDDAFDLIATIDRLSREDPATWRSVVRQYTATDWYILGLFLHGGQRLDPFTGRPEMDCDFLWNHFREVQFEGQGKLNKTFRGGWKCMAEDTPVRLSNGQSKAIKYLEVGDSVVSFDGYRAGHGKVLAVVPTGQKLVRRFQTDGARTFDVTDDHRILTAKGWLDSRNIKVGDWVGIPRTYRRQIDAAPQLTPDECYVLGCVVADGCTCCGPTGGVQWTNADEDVISAFYCACSQAGLRPKRAMSGKYKYYVGGARPLAQKFGIHQVKSVHKRLPLWFFSEPDENLWRFVGAFIDCDGHVPETRSRIIIQLANRGLLEDLQVIFDSLGVSSKLSVKHTQNGHAGHSSLTIGGLNSLHKVLECAGMAHPKKRARLVAAIDRLDCDEDPIPCGLWLPLLRGKPWDFREHGIGYCGPTTYAGRDKVARIAELEDNESLRRIVDADVRWERVKSVSDYETRETYDIEVSNGHSFIGSGVISHNSHILLYVGITNKVVVDPNRVMAIAAHEKSAAGKHGWRTALEWETNLELKAAWPDVFFDDPKRDPDCPMWNQETGVIVRRTIPAVLPTLSWWAIEHVPTGSRVSDFFFDDLENEDTVESEDQRKKLLSRFLSFKKTGGRLPSVYINATSHHPNGLVSHLERAQMYGMIHHPAEDVSRPAPDIAKLYDECEGRITNRSTGEVIDLPPAVRDIRLDGAPVMHHPLELAMMRLDALITDGGLAEYYRHMLGDNLAGEDKRLRLDWIRRYDADPVEMAEGAFLYIVVDPSKGIGDPTFARVEACRYDKTIAWVGGLRKKIDPFDFGKEIWLLCCQWEGIGIIKEVRFEIFAQATWDTMFCQYCEKVRHWPGNITRNNVKSIGRNTKNRVREWQALQPMYRAGKRLFPNHGVMFVEDENRRRIDLVKYYEDNELGLYPLPITDDGLAADALLGEPEDAKKGIFPIEFPESEDEMELRESLAWRRTRHGRMGSGGDNDDAGSWMEDGL